MVIITIKVSDKLNINYLKYNIINIINKLQDIIIILYNVLHIYIQNYQCSFSKL